MPASQKSIPTPSPAQSAQERLRDFLGARRRAIGPVADLELFERELHERFAASEAEAVANELARFDVDLPTPPCALRACPKHSKATLKASLSAELAAILARRPDLQVVKIADGARTTGAT